MTLKEKDYHLQLLGNTNTVYYDCYAPQVLETFENEFTQNDYMVTFDAYEFTSLCPVTGQPDFAKIYINYIPDKKMLESKSFKLYLFSFRNEKSFHENCVNTIMNDLVNLLQPKYLEVLGIFAPRGGIAIYPFANYTPTESKYEAFKTKRLFEVAAKNFDGKKFNS